MNLDRRIKADISIYSAFFGGLLALIYTLSYMEQLAYGLGFASGSATILKYYNISSPLPSAITALISGSGAALIALHITYVMLPVSVLSVVLAALWVFHRAYGRTGGAAIVFMAIVLLMLTALLDSDFSFGSGIGAYVPYFGYLLMLIGGAWAIIIHRTVQAGAHGSIEINPDTPYTNIIMLSRKMMNKLHGEIRILDMHFDDKAFENLAYMTRRNIGNYTSIRILTRRDRVGKDFEKAYVEFKKELENRAIALEIRVMGGDDAVEQHERMIMDSEKAYKIPPFNIINRKSEHIVQLEYSGSRKRFDEIWNRSTKIENFGR